MAAAAADNEVMERCKQGRWAHQEDKKARRENTEAFPPDLLVSLLPPEVVPTVGGSLPVSVNVTKKIPHRYAHSVSPSSPDPIKLSPRLNFTARLSQFRTVLCISQNATAVLTPFKCSAFVLSCLDNITSLSCYLYLLTQILSANLWRKKYTSGTSYVS